MKKRFIEFLRSKGLIVAYVTNLHSLSCTPGSLFKKHRNMTLGQVLKKENPKDYILNAFNWEDSPEQHGFWERANIQWRIISMKQDKPPVKKKSVMA